MAGLGCSKPDRRRGAPPGVYARAVRIACLLTWGAGLVLALTQGRAGAAEVTETNSFNAAAKEYQAGFWKQAEADFADFTKKYPDSPRLPEAFLCQAVARYHLTNYAGAIELLAGNQGRAGKRGDDYLFWQAKSLHAKGESAAAAEAFGRLIQQFPGSQLCLESGVEDARACATLGDWGRVVELLRNPVGVFQSAVKTNAANDSITYGWLLLGEAQYARRDYGGVEAALDPLARMGLEGKKLNPAANWQWQYLLVRLRAAQGRAEEAQANTTNLIAAAVAAGDPERLAETHAFVGEFSERLGRGDEAVNAYTNNLAAGVPADRQTQALERVTGLLVASNRLASAATRLEDFATRLPEAPGTPLALVLLAETRLRQWAADPTTNPPTTTLTNAPAGTNALDKAVAALVQVMQMTNKAAQAAYLGRAGLDLGWGYWLQSKWAECQAACQVAVDHLPSSREQAIARFKLGDAQYELTNYDGAITQYKAIVETYGSLPEVRTNLFEPALYQWARAGLAKGDLAAATNALGRILANYPNSFRTEKAVLLFGQEVNRRGNPAEARRLFEEAAQRAADTALAPQFFLATARAYERADNLREAIATYLRWIGLYPTNAARPRAEYCLAVDYALAGQVTNAYALMTNFVARYTNDTLWPLAQWWLGDFHYRYENQYLQAELAYMAIYKNTNLPPSDLTYQAQLMAGRAAFHRQGWPEAINHFTNLTSLATNAGCPKLVRVEALFAYGETLVSQESSNKFADYLEASRVFNEVRMEQPTNRLAAAALGARADCYWQLAQQKGQSDQLTNAAQAYQEAMLYPGAEVRIRTMAEIGLGRVLEKQAAPLPEPRRGELLNEALKHYLHVCFGENFAPGESPDPFSLEKAGLEAARLAEQLGEWTPAIKVYKLLGEWLPPLRPGLQPKISKAIEKGGVP